MYHGFLNKKNNEGLFYSKEDLISALALPKFFNPVGCIDDYLACQINIVNVLDGLKSGTKFNAELIDRLRSITENSGPVFILIHFI
jgi:hypothetical protein